MVVPFRSLARASALLALLLVRDPGAEAGDGVDDGTWVRGMTISCQTHGAEWGSDAFARELDELAGLGVNWIAIHPYARIHGDGRVTSRLDPRDPPPWLTRPLAEARSRGLRLLVKPHLAYWGSPFSWRGAIEFEDPADLERFREGYRAFVLDLAEVCSGADAFCVGTELDRLVVHEDFWRGLVADVRRRTGARLTYAANWDRVGDVPFWDELDAIGVQGYYPLVAAPGAAVDRASLERGLAEHLAGLRSLHLRTGKPVVLTELGYDDAPTAALRPWEPRGRGTPADPALQQRCLEAALACLERERTWLRGAFLWKWFAGPAPGEDYVLDRPELRELLARRWGEGGPGERGFPSGR